MNELTVDEKAAISYYDITEIQDGEGYRVGTQSRIKLHNKMSALDKIARHLNFYGTVGKPVSSRESRVLSPESEGGGSPESGVESLESEQAAAVAVVDRSTNNLPMDYPVEDFELEGIELKTLMALEGVDVSPGSLFDEFDEGTRSKEQGLESLKQKAFLEDQIENIENILTISPLVESQKSKLKSQNDFPGGDGAREFALRMGADTGPVAKAGVV
jgi:hypothetical protein